jgi:hypothetical protein
MATEQVGTVEYRELVQSMGAEKANMLVKLKLTYTDDARLLAAKFLAPIGVHVTGKH